MNKEIFDFLVCPKCKGNLKVMSKNKKLYCENGKKTYIIYNNIPIMI